MVDKQKNLDLGLEANFAHHVTELTLMVIISFSLVVVYGTNIHHEVALHGINVIMLVCCMLF